MTADVSRVPTRSFLLRGIAAGAGALAVAAAPMVAGASSGTKTFSSERYHYSVTLPAGCRHEEGPGTIDAVCAADFDPDRSAKANSATALVMEVVAEAVAGDAASAAQAHSEAAVRQELPQAVCGESDAARVRIDNLKRTVESDGVAYTADVICAEVRFLQIAERRATVRYLIAPDARYRLVARAPTEEFEKQKSAIDAFFQSFRVLPAGKQSQ